jgi:hypothetical protein
MTRQNCLYKLLLALSLLMLKAKSTHGLKCGTALTTVCLGDTDVRYDPKASNDLMDQSSVWSRIDGFYIGGGTRQTFDQTTQSLTEELTVIQYANHSIEGSRGMYHRFIFAPDFTGNPAEYALSDVYFTSSHEKDGRALNLGLRRQTVVPGQPDAIEERPFGAAAGAEDQEVTYPTGDISVFGVTESSDFLIFEAIVFLDQDTYRVVSERFDYENGLPRFQSRTTSSFRRVTESEWIDSVNQAYLEYGVNETNAPAIPMTTDCLVGTCPTQEEWCELDPTCSPSPYQEPPASLKAGPVVGIVLMAVVVIGIVMFAVQKLMVRRQVRRYKTAFAKRIAGTIEVRKSMRSLTPAALIQEFQLLDEGTKDGIITREELWEFLQTGKAGELSESDFNALFAAMDSGHDGTVDFLEFCSFLAQCHEEYNVAALRRGSSGKMSRSASRVSLAESIAESLVERSVHESQSRSNYDKQSSRAMSFGEEFPDHFDDGEDVRERTVSWADMAGIEFDEELTGNALKLNGEEEKKYDI